MLHGLFAESCPACAGSSVAGFCDGCGGDLARVPDPCRGCGLPQPVVHCPRRQGRWLVASIVAPFAYAAPLDGYLHALKYREARNLGRALALLVAADLRRETAGVDALVPVPLHGKRLRERGYNQAVEIARTLASELRLPSLLRGIRRARSGTPQSVQKAVQRRAGMVGAFAIDRDLRGARLAIVDDVITTGATVNALAAELLDAGAAEVRAWAVARTL
jgi:ComF family protein